MGFYKFEIGENVQVKSTGDKGIVTGRRFALISIHNRNLFPANYYTVKIQESYEFNGESRTVSFFNLECKEKSLEKLAQ